MAWFVAFISGSVAGVAVWVGLELLTTRKGSGEIRPIAKAISWRARLSGR